MRRYLTALLGWLTRPIKAARLTREIVCTRDDDKAFKLACAYGMSREVAFQRHRYPHLSEISVVRLRAYYSPTPESKPTREDIEDVWRFLDECDRQGSFVARRMIAEHRQVLLEDRQPAPTERRAIYDNRERW